MIFGNYCLGFLIFGWKIYDSVKSMSVKWTHILKGVIKSDMFNGMIINASFKIARCNGDNLAKGKFPPDLVGEKKEK